MDYFNAFWVGGLICALAQILMEKTKMLPGRIMVTLVCSGAVLGAFGIYEPLMEYAGAGASVPLLGFGNLLWKGMRESDFLWEDLRHVRSAFLQRLYLAILRRSFSSQRCVNNV